MADYGLKICGEETVVMRITRITKLVKKTCKGQIKNGLNKEERKTPTRYMSVDCFEV